MPPIVTGLFAVAAAVTLVTVPTPGVNPNNPVISADVAFATTPVPFARNNVFPVTPDTVNPVNVGLSPMPNPNVVLEAPILATSLKLFDGRNGV